MEEEDKTKETEARLSEIFSYFEEFLFIDIVKKQGSDYLSDKISVFFDFVSDSGIEMDDEEKSKIKEIILTKYGK